MSLFEDPSNIELSEEPLGPGATILRNFAISEETEILSGLSDVVSKAPFRHMITPGGFRMSVAMTNCGALGWVTDRTGYRYDPMDPESGLPWPPMPASFLALARNAAAKAGFKEFVPDACLINRYDPGARLTLHLDKASTSASVVKLSRADRLELLRICPGTSPSEKSRPWEKC